jgi:biopolymer transport protein ExbD
MRNRFRRRRLEGQSTDINITAFMNLMVILVPFLLITAVFSRITVLQLNLPAAAAREQNVPQPDFDLEIIVRDGDIEVGDRSGGLIRRLPRTPAGYDYQQLSQLLQQIKARFPDKLNATLLLEADVPYDTLVQVMDRVRVARIVATDGFQSAELFPEISIGDAPPGVKVANQ